MYINLLVQRNFRPVDELGEPVVITSIEGKIPDNFPEGVYLRNGHFLVPQLNIIYIYICFILVFIYYMIH